MSNSMYNNSIPVMALHLDNLAGLLNSALDYAKHEGIDEWVLTNSRLFPDMHPLSKQVQIACDTVKRGAARMAGLEPPVHEDTETTFAELQARIASTKAYLLTLPEDAINGSENIVFEIPAGPYKLTFKGAELLTLWIMPNMYFHISTTYNILRHNGVKIGKLNFLGLSAFVTSGP